MKRIALFLINIYQNTIAVTLFNLGLKGDCRFYPTCSEYTKISISQKGLVKGSYLSMVRLLKCQPFYHGN
ncbi:MAG: membrane protein insertion efficiency factor YidD [Candidatus Levyibacteriota bacterium]|jgi:putative membrane protein insertion efficiency factor